VVCNRCSSDKPESNFGTYSNGNGKGRIYTRKQCLKCRTAFRNKEKNSECSLRCWRKKFSKNKEAWNSKVREYRLKRKLSGNPIKRNCASDKYRSNSRINIFFRAEVRRIYGTICSYCFLEAKTIDHVVPLNKGGLNEIENLVPACNSCNSSKQDQHLTFWLARKAG